MRRQAHFSNRASSRLLLTCALMLILLTGSALAQSTAFTYQGKLADSGNPANGSYDLQFKLFDTVTVGTGAQQGSTVTVSNVTVSGGIFTVQLDFGACATCFNGAARYLEIAVKPTSGSTFTTLGPRQAVSPSPYAIRSQIATTADNALQLSGTSFNISGNGTAGGTLTGSIVNAVQQVNINGQRAFTVNGPFDNGAPIAATNTFAGDSAGLNTTPSPTLSDDPGKFNSFYGAIAGRANTTGNYNAFFGAYAGQVNTTGGSNAFFGMNSGASNSTGSANSFFGVSAGGANTTGHDNAFFGALSGVNGGTGSNNAYFGSGTGLNSGSGDNNAFFGSGADFSSNNTAGANNSLLGYRSRVGVNLTNATAVGALASVTQSNSLVLGSINGVNGATADTGVGIGTTAPAARLHVVGNWNGQHGALTLQGDKPTIRFSGGAVAGNQQWMLHLGSDGPGSLEFFNGGTTGTWGSVLTMTPAGAVGIGTTSPADRLHVFGDVRVGTSGTNGCLKNNNGGAIVGTCSSDARFKRAIAPFPNLLDKLARLRPVYFYWRAEQFPGRGFGQAQESGLIAQEVEKVLPELVIEDEQGYKAVNYSKLPLLTLQAVKELKAENDALKQKLNEQGQELAVIKQLLCSAQPQAELCIVKSVK